MTTTSRHRRAVIEQVADLRRELHRHPELRFTETESQRRIAATIAEVAPAAEVSPVAGTGLVVRLPDRPARTGRARSVLLRADMDAYPVTEETGLPYASTRSGVSHACGHDVHMATLVGVLAALSDAPPECGSVTALFQPAEEIPYGEPSGARTVLAEGRLADRYDAVLGLHCWPDLPAGRVGVNGRISMAAKDAFRIDVAGTAAHVASASRGRDAILASAALVQSLHAAIARRRDSDDMVGFNVGTLSGGASQSQVAATATMTGTLRTHEPAVRQQLRAVVEQVVRGIATAHDVTATLTWADEMPAVVNDPGLVTLARSLRHEGLDVVDLPRSPLTADDFALLTGLGPGLYLKLGTAAADEPTAAPLHSSGFRVDERCLPVGIRVLELLTRRVLAGIDQHDPTTEGTST